MVDWLASQQLNGEAVNAPRVVGTVAAVDSIRADLCGYTFRRTAMGELPLVNDLYNRCHQSSRSLAEAEWLYHGHPYGEAVILGAFAANNELGGVLPAIAHRFVWNGLEETGYQLVDAVVAHEHRNRGIFGHLVQRMCEIAEEKKFIVFAFPNDRSLSVYRKTGLLQSIGACETRVKVLSWPGYVRYRLGRKGRGSEEPTPTSDAAILSDGDLFLVPVCRFESEFEDVHAEVAKTVTSFTLRRKEFLNWRYFGFRRKHYRVALIGRADRTQGYVVIRVINRIAHVVDVFVTPDRRVGRKAVRLVTRWARRMGAIAVYFSASEGSFVRPAFARSGFLLKKRDGEIVLDPRSVSRLTSLHRGPIGSGDVYFVMGDGDFY